jgi:hypothetical protein
VFRRTAASCPEGCFASAVGCGLNGEDDFVIRMGTVSAARTPDCRAPRRAPAIARRIAATSSELEHHFQARFLRLLNTLLDAYGFTWVDEFDLAILWQALSRQLERGAKVLEATSAVTRPP